jgi:hypothetical protein
MIGEITKIVAYWDKKCKYLEEEVMIEPVF